MAGLLDDLDPEQRAAALAVTGPVCIIAGAGTGKTRTVTYRLAQGISSGAVRPGTTLAITHSRKAAAELRERLGRLGIKAGDALTFHAAGLQVARRFWDRTDRPQTGPQVLSESDAWRLWRDSLRAVTRSEPDNAAVRDVMDEVGWARSRLLGAGAYSAAANNAGRDPGVEPSVIISCWEAYSRAKNRVGRVDFADLLEIAAGLVEADETIAATVRSRWAHVTVDEYQDTDAAQQRLLEAIVGHGRDLCVVGDPRQAVYSWKGADPGYLTGFTARYPDARVFDLTRNYRSTPQILEWANRLARGSGARALVATRPGGGQPRVTRAEDEGAEAAWVAGAVRRAVDEGTPVSEMAVLYRFNATQARFEAALARAGIATVVAEDATFFDREDIRSVLVPFGRSARAQPEVPGLELLATQLARAGFDRDRPPEGLGAARARWESHQALVELVEASPEMAAADARGLLAEINALAVRTHGPRGEGVTLSTLHRAKGLEWDVVFLVGMNEGAMPSAFADGPDELAEEERLLHVGVSRARRELHLTWPATNARGWENRPSPYLDLLPAIQRGRKPDRQKSARTDGSARTKTDRKTSGATCPHCAGSLKGISARRLGVCADCVLRAPGELGRRARALATVVAGASSATGRSEAELVSPSALVRLLDLRPTTESEVAATTGVRLSGKWAKAVADVLRA